MCPGKSICSPPHFSEISPVLPLKHFQCWTDWWWLFLVLSVKVVKCFLFLCLSPLDVPWCEVLCFVPADNVSSSSTLQILWDTSHLSMLFCPPDTNYCHPHNNSAGKLAMVLPLSAVSPTVMSWEFALHSSQSGQDLGVFCSVLLGSQLALNKLKCMIRLFVFVPFSKLAPRCSDVQLGNSVLVPTLAPCVSSTVTGNFFCSANHLW